MQDVAVDACCLINLLAAGPILSSPPSPKSPRRKKAVSTEADEPPGIGLTLHVPAKVTQETFYLLQPDEEDGSKLVKTPIEVAPFIQAGVIHSCDLEGEQELELFVQLATRLDDGEAACFAIAQSRSWLLATDDRPATKLAAQAGLIVITTPELVKRWAGASGAADEEVTAVIQNIQTFARFVPRPDAPECAWWMSMASKAAN
jgi:predicted nucleic acid-binding protein